jgi:hypothetical protein
MDFVPELVVGSQCKDQLSLMADLDNFLTEPRGA